MDLAKLGVIVLVFAKEVAGLGLEKLPTFQRPPGSEAFEFVSIGVL